MRRHFVADLNHESAEYLNECARVRGISMSALVRRLMETIAKDKLVLSILDDNGECRRRRGERAARKRPSYDLRKEYPL